MRVKLTIIAILFGMIGIPANAETNQIWQPEKISTETNVMGWQITEDMLPRYFRTTQVDNWIALILPRCANEESKWCVENLRVYSVGNPATDAIFLREIDESETKQNDALGFPAGGGVGLWKSVTTASATEELYAVSAQIIFTNTPDAGTTFGDLEVRVSPYYEDRGISPSTGEKYVSVRGNDNYGGGPYPECAWTEDNLCGRIKNFKKDIRVGLTIRVGAKMIRSIAARGVNPQVSIEKREDNQIAFTVDAAPVDLPKFFAYENKDMLSPAMKSTFWPGVDRESGISTISSGNMKSFSILNAWKDKVQDKATALVSTWQYRTIPWFEPGERCFEDDKFYGVVATNALVTDGSGFQFGGINGLEYRVAGLHLNPDGTVFQGTYELSMRRDVAECIFGLTGAPISASIVIVQEGKEQRIETTSFKESLRDKVKFLEFSAQGFTFSSPTLRIKLSQATPKKKAITCTKGKVTKKILGVNPKCPTGFKKK